MEEKTITFTWEIGFFKLVAMCGWVPACAGMTAFSPTLKHSQKSVYTSRVVVVGWIVLDVVQVNPTGVAHGILSLIAIRIMLG